MAQRDHKDDRRQGRPAGSPAEQRGHPRRGALLAAAALVLATAGVGCAPGSASSAPVPPPQYLGLDSYLHWDALPYLEIGDRVAGQSTADPEGSNNDNVHTLGTLPDGERVLFDQEGPGVLTFLRMQQATGGPWHLSIDGTAPTVIAGADLGRNDPAARFPYPLSLDTAQTPGSSIIASSLPFHEGLRFTSSAANGNFYSLYRKLPIDASVPQWTPQETQQAQRFLASAGSDLTPPGAQRDSGAVALRAGAPTPLLTIDGSNEIRSITFRVPFGEKVRFGNTRLRIYWDGAASPSVDAPVKYLTGDGAGVYQPTGRDLVRALPAGIAGDGATYEDFSLYWPMPFTSKARVELVSGDDIPTPVNWSVSHVPFTDPPSWVGQFHANYTDNPNPRPGADMTFLDYQGSGKLVGTVVNFGAVGGTLEGDPHIYLDGSRTPQIAGTGTEEWGMGGDYWNNGHQTTLPLAGLPSSTTNPAGSDVDGAAEYRFLIADSVPFNNRLLVNWEHGAVNDSHQRYRATMLWYGTPHQTAIASDEVIPGSPDSAAAHGYRSPGDRRIPLTSGYEDTVQAEQVAGSVAATSGRTEFTLAVEPGNVGAFLRRTFDSCVPNQRANVFLDGQFAGTWFNPGPSANPAATRCWRDDDLPLPKSLTAGKRSLHVRIDNIAPDPQSTPWTAADYRLFSFTT